MVRNHRWVGSQSSWETASQTIPEATAKLILSKVLAVLEVSSAGP